MCRVMIESGLGVLPKRLKHAEYSRCPVLCLFCDLLLLIEVVCVHQEWGRKAQCCGSKELWSHCSRSQHHCLCGCDQESQRLLLLPRYAYVLLTPPPPPGESNTNTCCCSDKGVALARGGQCPRQGEGGWAQTRHVHGSCQHARVFSRVPGRSRKAGQAPRRTTGVQFCMTCVC